jgi:hypothetical protein
MAHNNTNHCQFYYILFDFIASIKHCESADDEVCYNQNTQKFVNVWATQARTRIKAPPKIQFIELQSD